MRNLLTIAKLAHPLLEPPQANEIHDTVLNTIEQDLDLEEIAVERILRA